MTNIRVSNTALFFLCVLHIALSRGRKEGRRNWEEERDREKEGEGEKSVWGTGRGQKEGERQWDGRASGGGLGGGHSLQHPAHFSLHRAVRFVHFLGQGPSRDAKGHALLCARLESGTGRVGTAPASGTVFGIVNQQLLNHSNHLTHFHLWQFSPWTVIN